MLPRRNKQAHIAVTGDGFDILDGKQGAQTFRFDRITRIEAYKRDEITTDLICFDIHLAGDPPLVVFAREEVEGWKQLTERLAQLPGFDADWYAKVVQPPFAENRTVVYERQTA